MSVENIWVEVSPPSPAPLGGGGPGTNVKGHRSLPGTPSAHNILSECEEILQDLREPETGGEENVWTLNSFLIYMCFSVPNYIL